MAKDSHLTVDATLVETEGVKICLVSNRENGGRWVMNLEEKTDPFGNTSWNERETIGLSIEVYDALLAKVPKVS